MYRLAHHAIYTESERAKWKKDKDENDRGECKRCLIDYPEEAPHVEDLRHAFYNCGAVSALWQLAIKWITALFPNLEPSDMPDD
ncbi:hypothetical protein BGW41_006293, partial [Actinomortierella wolfii]